MSDEAFYLTPLDIRRYDCGTEFRGYSKATVDRLREQMADELERITRVNQDLDLKAKNFHEQLRAFRERDKALNDALISAQQLRAETREQAEREAQLILREARAEGERLVEAARGEVRRLSAEIDSLERSRRSYLSQLRSLVERQLADVVAAESSEPATPDAGGRGHGHGAGGDSRSVHQTPAWLDSLVKE